MDTRLAQLLIRLGVPASIVTIIVMIIAFLAACTASVKPTLM